MKKSDRLAGAARVSELIAAVLALEERDQLDLRERRRLDREIGAATQSRSGLALLRAWLAAAPSEPLARRLAQIRSALATLRTLLAAIGFFFGWGAAAALLSIEVHAGRINIVLAFAVLVLLPFVTILISVFLALRTAFSRGAAAPTGAGVLLSGFGLTRLALRLLPASVRGDVSNVLGRMTAHGRLYGRVERGQFLVWSQTMGVAFACGSLVATIVFVAFTDLAFGWSSTLAIEARTVYVWVHHLALPWAGIWPAASPTLELVESTRFFRVAVDDHDHLIDPILLGGWWPFLVASILTYSLLPRLILALLLGRWHVREVGRSIGLTPGIDRLLDRLQTPVVEGQALTDEAEIGRGARDLVPEVALANWFDRESGDEPVVLRWASLLDDTALMKRLGRPGIRIFDVGGRQSLGKDDEALRNAAAAESGVAFCVRAYEPPVLDVLDTLAQLRDKMGQDPSLAVVLVDGSDKDETTWRRKLTELGDPRLVAASVAASNG